MAFDTFSPGKWGTNRYRSGGVGGAASLVNVAAALQNITRNRPDYQGIGDTNITNRANLRNEVRRINSGLIAQKIQGKAEVRRSDELLAAHEKGMSKVQSAQEGAAWKKVLGAGIGLLGGFIL